MFKIREMSAFMISLVIHAIVFIALGMVHYAVQTVSPELLIETVFSEDRTQEEFEQKLEVATDVAETMNVIPGSVAAANAIGGTGAPAVNQKAIEASETLKTPDLTVNVGTIDVSGLAALGTDLGDGEVTGEIGAAVEGYGAALKRITQEIIRHMRESRVIVVWLFDESDSMKDDQIEIRNQFHTVYEELGIATKTDENFKANKEVLQSVILSYGEKINQHTERPTSDIPTVQAAIDKIGIDESGKENMCMALAATLDKYGPMARSSRRKLVVILVSDESGDDGMHVDAVVEKAKRYESPIYVLGREAVFGYPYARLRWQDPKYGLTHWLQINRGPETAYPEALQFDGLHARWDAHSSGFGPYEQVRLAKESGGIFFVLPGEEENLVGKEAAEKRNFQFLDMKPYVPTLEARRKYEQERDASKFRRTLWEVIVRLNPHLDKELNIREHHYPIEPAAFQKEGAVNFQRAIRAMTLLQQATDELKKIRPLRDKEDSERWRANYDLILAQTMAYRVRLFQYCLALDQHSKNRPQPKDAKSNEWNLRRVQKLLEPDPQVVKQTKIDYDLLKKEEQEARDQFAFVIRSHPRTPWSNRAEYELRQGFGFQFVDGFRDPRYKNLEGIKFPKP